MSIKEKTKIHNDWQNRNREKYRQYQREYHQRYILEHPEYRIKQQESGRNYRARMNVLFPGKLKKMHHEYYLANRDRFLRERKSYYQANREKLLQYQREYHAKLRKSPSGLAGRQQRSRAYYQAHREKLVQYQRDYRRKNKSGKK